MFYQNYDDYMRDIFYFNGLANNPNNNMFYMQNPASQNNLNSYYPSIYKIISPVVQRVVTGTNYQYVNEDLLNDMVNTVSGIVEGDISNIENVSSNNNNSNNDNRRMNQTTTQVNASSNTAQTQSTNISNNNSLLRDLIKILVIKELNNRNNVRRFPFSNSMMNVPYYQMPMMNSPYMVN